MKALSYSLAWILALFLVACSSPEEGEPEAGAREVETPAAEEPVEEVAQNPVVTVSTTMGDIRIELYPEKAPATVENFLAYAKEGYFEQTVFHRVISEFMIQGGGFALEDGGVIRQKDTKAPVQNEAKNGLLNARGTIAMARTSDPHSATSQFFINTQDNTNLDYPSFDSWGYAVFGKVVEGLEVVDAIEGVSTSEQTLVTRAGPRPMGDVPDNPIVIQSVTVE